IHLLPMSDGGDGFGHVISNLLGAKKHVVRTINAAGRACQMEWWWDPKSRTAMIESARVVGLAMLKKSQRKPLHLDTFGLGAVMRMAERHGAVRCLIGLGGSATND